MHHSLNDAELRSIPAVEKLLRALGPLDLPRPHIVAEIRRLLAAIRSEASTPSFEVILQRLRDALRALRRSRLQPVINATGIVLHTNFGRAPLAASSVQAIADIAAGYSNLEYDLNTGARGGRACYVQRSLALLCAAESAVVVNNCAAALVLILRQFTETKKEVVISRGELIQIGGGFRIPEILESTGARLREVGTTNRTSLDDYARVIGAETGMILKVHRSNFSMEGFVESPATAAIAELARTADIPFVEDLGSGAMLDTAGLAGLGHEPTPAEALGNGVDLVCFSGDKLLGGPQAGIIAGRAALVQSLERHPLFRALRCDKLVFAALQSTVDQYLAGTAETGVTALSLLKTTPAELQKRAEAIVAAVNSPALRASVRAAEAEVGGGTLPQSRIPSIAVDLLPRGISLEQFAMRLRECTPAVIGCISCGRFRVDLRTVFPEQDRQLVFALQSVIQSPCTSSSPF